MAFSPELTRRIFPILAGSVAVLLLSGCPIQLPAAKPAAPMGAGERIAAAQHGADTATAVFRNAEDEWLSKLRANIDAILSAPNIEASPVAQNEAIVAQGRMSGIKPDAAEVAAAAERRVLVESGRADEARHVSA